MMAPAKKKSSRLEINMDTRETHSFLQAGKIQPLDILDVRTEKEYVSGHIPGALNLDFFARDFRSRLDKLDKGKTFLIICHSGGRSARAVEIMQQKGFKQLYHAKDGMSRWLLAKYPLQRGLKPGDRSELVSGTTEKIGKVKIDKKSK